MTEITKSWYTKQKRCLRLLCATRHADCVAWVLHCMRNVRVVVKKPTTGNGAGEMCPYIFAKYICHCRVVDGVCVWMRDSCAACTAYTACCKCEAVVAPTPTSSPAADSSGPRRTLLSSWWCTTAALSSFESRYVGFALARTLDVRYIIIAFLYTCIANCLSGTVYSDTQSAIQSVQR